MPVRCANMRPARCGAPPRLVAKLSLPGFALASATNSLIVFTGTLGCVARRCGEYETVITGTRSRSPSNGSFEYKIVLMTRLPMSVSISV